MRLADKYRPRQLCQVVGQPVATTKLLRFAAEPYSMCWLLEGPPGVGKTSAAYALAGDMKCEDEMSGQYTVVGSELTIERARDLFQGSLHLRPLYGDGWRVLVIEELENLSPQCQRFLKVALETQLPKKCVVVATSNDSSALDKALRQRFTKLVFDGGASFASSCAAWLTAVWLREHPGAPIDVHVLREGWDGDTFSLRRALDALQWCSVGS